MVGQPLVGRLSCRNFSVFGCRNFSVVFPKQNYSLNIYNSHALAPGSPFLAPEGAHIFNRLQRFMQIQQTASGFEPVVSPLMFKNKLWMQSGHWDHYRDDMFALEAESDDAAENYSLKPMNCPGHCLLYKTTDHSFRQLPVRYADYSALHRNEASGALTGLTRVRKFHQDDGHIFCRLDQVQSEIASCLDMVRSVYSVFGFDHELTLSTRPESFAGTIEQWSEAETALTQALNNHGRPWTINSQDGAFYGPKIDILLKSGPQSATPGKKHQAATIQLDFQLPASFELQYAAQDQTMHRPVLIHRAVFGSIERFLALLMDHYGDLWPLWLNPRQVAVVPVAERHVEYAQSIAGFLRASPTPSLPLSTRQFRADVFSSDETVNARVRRATAMHFAFIVMVGDRDIEAGTMAVRRRGDRQVVNMSSQELHNLLCDLEDRYD